MTWKHQIDIKQYLKYEGDTPTAAEIATIFAAVQKELEQVPAAVRIGAKFRRWADKYRVWLGL